MPKTDLDIAYERFLSYLPTDGDLALLILKGHLLVEEQIIFLIKNRIPKSDAIKDAELTAHQKICLAEALVSETGGRVDIWLWPAVKKLNKLRNDIAHKLSDSGVKDRMIDLAQRVQGPFPSVGDVRGDFESALFTIYLEIHNRIEELDESDCDIE
jgi:hypothetical protein